MSTTATARPAARPAALDTAALDTADRPAARTGEPAASAPAAPRERLATSPFADWRDATPTEELPALSGAITERRLQSRERVSARRARARLRPHIRAALAGIALAAVLLTGLQLYAASGITSARQAALASQTTKTEQAPTPTSMSERTSAAPNNVRSDIEPDWVTEDTHAPYDRTNPHASPLLSLPHCTTSPDTPMPCLAHVSADSRRAVILEEDASLTALVAR